MNNKQEFELLNGKENKEEDKKYSFLASLYVFLQITISSIYIVTCIFCKIIEIFFSIFSITKRTIKRKKKRRF